MSDATQELDGGQRELLAWLRGEQTGIDWDENDDMQVEKTMYWLATRHPEWLLEQLRHPEHPLERKCRAFMGLITDSDARRRAAALLGFEGTMAEQFAQAARVVRLQR